MPYTVLTINPGSTSTKIGVFSGGKEIFTESVAHSAEDISRYSCIADQFEFREQHIRKTLDSKGFDLSTLDCVVGRGGLLSPIPGGVYKVNEAMKAELRSAKNGEHASNLGALIADRLASEIGKPAFIADPVVVDELSPLARFSGHKAFTHRSIFHALNQKAVARRYSLEIGKKYEDLNLIVCHLGGGISVGLHQKGRVVDVNNALDGEGPFSPERSGTLPTGQLVKLCFSGTVTEKEVKKMLVGAGGLVSFTGLNDVREVKKLIAQGDKNAEAAFNAMVYQIGKAIGALASAAEGKVDAIIVTGGIAYNKDLTDKINDMTGWICKNVVYPGEGELEALALAGERVLSGDAVAQTYTS